MYKWPKKTVFLPVDSCSRCRERLSRGGGGGGGGEGEGWAIGNLCGGRPQPTEEPTITSAHPVAVGLGARRCRVKEGAAKKTRPGRFELVVLSTMFVPSLSWQMIGCLKRKRCVFRTGCPKARHHLEAAGKKERKRDLAY
jgi:hypothetical protein